MAVSKACKKCKHIIEKGTVCPVCQNTDLTTNWKGFAIIIDPENSEIAKKLEITVAGKYALRLSK
ncbi:DNA-directed RNA polymerase, subunit E'' [archaeon]|nr:DNA-directed RNA polymerase, subunit E'' [archaeon]